MTTVETWKVVLAEGAVREVEVIEADGGWQASVGGHVGGFSRKSARRAVIQFAMRAEWPLAAVVAPGVVTSSALQATVRAMRARVEASLRNDGVDDVEGSAVCLVYDIVNDNWLGFLGDTDATNVHTEGDACATPEEAIASLDAALKREVPGVA